MHIFFATAQGQCAPQRSFRFPRHPHQRQNRHPPGRGRQAHRRAGLRRERPRAAGLRKSGKCIRFPVDDVRVFKSRTCDGVRGMKLAEGDEVVSLSILGGIADHAPKNVMHTSKWRWPSAAPRAARPRKPRPLPLMRGRRERNRPGARTFRRNGRRRSNSSSPSPKTATASAAAPTNTAPSAAAVRGIINIITSARNGKVVASQPVAHGRPDHADDRPRHPHPLPVHDIRIAGRNTQGVTILSTSEGEKVVSVVRAGEGESTIEEGEI